jgi:hypothetical protein
MSDKLDREALDAAWQQFVDAGNSRLAVKEDSLRKSLEFRVRLLIYSAVVALPIIAIAYIRVLTSPPFFALREAPTAGQFITQPKPISIDKLSKTAIDEVKKREGWSGTPTSHFGGTEGNWYFFLIQRDPTDKKPIAAARITLDCFTGEILSYDLAP